MVAQHSDGFQNPSTMENVALSFKNNFPEGDQGRFGNLIKRQSI
jgi:hypothetical protein